MKIRIVGLVLLSGLIIGGFTAGFFTNSIKTALTLQPTMMQAPSALGMASATNKQAQEVNRLPNTPTTTLAQDTFQRANQPLWGTASDGRMWDGDANTMQTFSIVGHSGQIGNGSGTFNAVLGPAIADSEVLLSGSMSQFHADMVNIGAVLRWSDGNNWYKALLDGTHLIVLKRLKGATTQLGSVLFAAQDGVVYSIRFRAVGATLFAKAWPSNTTEPVGWAIAVNDLSFTTGQSGIRVLLQTGSTVTISAFRITAAS
ncbi:MAG: hypothetical protein JO125_11165 [Chloroflexi bacterium]|nr:hypothetical protein [Ktedonobacteraceae bacterium]MBV8822338.1 hypothetical protein [Ktedonobacteraceae bacterium]MBV9021244.1 hypothetical protein [Ktedonobacteraceae bacterium]MBV9707952.1 hypothetical protein [Chloroflexota bacterium]